VFYSAGEMAYHMGQFREANERLAEAVRLRRQLGDAAGLSMALAYHGRSVARTAATPADFERGKALMTEAVAHSRECGALWWAAWAMLLLGWSAWENAELDLAATVLRDSEGILTQLGEPHAHSHVICPLGSVLCEQGDLARGRALIEQALAESRAGRYCVDGVGEALYRLALLGRSQDELIVATKQAIEALTVLAQGGNPAPLADPLELLAGLACDQGLAERAATLFGAASGVREKLGMRVPPIQRTAYRRDVAATRRMLGKDEFAARWATGLRMSDDEVIEYAQAPHASAAPVG
jgi:hypothetical protein